jgi:LysM repeat protein
MNGTARLNLVTASSGAAACGLSGVGGPVVGRLVGVAAPARPGAARPARGTRSALRLTRRGRAALLSVLVGAAVVGGLTVGQNPSVASGEAAEPRSYTYVVAEPGDTLWQIARRAAPGVDPRITIGRIRDLNALPGVDIQTGQRIALP